MEKQIFEVKIVYSDGRYSITIDKYPIIKETRDGYHVKICDSFVQILKKRDENKCAWTTNFDHIGEIKTKLVRQHVETQRQVVKDIVARENAFIKYCTAQGVDTSGLRL